MLRARDFHKKEDAIKVLKTKAAFRNPDEFYFSMEKSRTKEGVHVGRGDESNKYTADELRLMKTQDVKYVGLRASMEAKKAEKLRANLHLLGGAGDAAEDDRGYGDDDDDEFDAVAAFTTPKRSRKHTIFVESEDAARTFNAAAHFVTAEEDVHARPHNRRRTAPGHTASEDGTAAKRAARAAGKGLGLKRGLVRAAEEEAGEGAGVELDPRVEKKLEKKRRVAYQLLKEREERARRLKAMTAEMAMQKEISHAKGHKRKLKAAAEEDDTPDGLAHLKKAAPVFRWKKERKR